MFGPKMEFEPINFQLAESQNQGGMSAGSGLKSMENAVTGSSCAMKGMSAFWATLMSLTLVRAMRPYQRPFLAYQLCRRISLAGPFPLVGWPA